MLNAVVERARFRLTKIDLDGTIRFANRVIAGLEMSQVVGTNWLDWILPDQRGMVKAALTTTMIATGEPNVRYETRRAAARARRPRGTPVRIGPIREGDKDHRRGADRA